MGPVFHMKTSYTKVCTWPPHLLHNPKALYLSVHVSRLGSSRRGFLHPSSEDMEVSKDGNTPQPLFWPAPQTCPWGDNSSQTPPQATGVTVIFLPQRGCSVNRYMWQCGEEKRLTTPFLLYIILLSALSHNCLWSPTEFLGMVTSLIQVHFLLP